MESKNYKIRNILLSVILAINIVIIALLLYFLSPVTIKSNSVDFIISEGDSIDEIAHNLKKEGLIKNENIFKAYLTLKKGRYLYAAKYHLNSNQSLNKIVKTLKQGGVNPDEITITFKEGLNMKKVAQVISENTNNSYEDVLNKANDSTYLKTVINKYWFVTKDIENKDIYYKLEGYLFPDSYNFSSKDVDVETIFNNMLDHMNIKISPYKESIEKNKYSTHQLFTMASIVELEAIDKTSRKDVSGVFYNRLNSGMTLGSDVTSYYGVGKEMTSDITQSELDNINPYNTRVASMAGKLPVSPICNFSIESLDAALNPNKHDYLYFVADKNGKIYMTKDFATHEKVIADLKSKGLWLEW